MGTRIGFLSDENMRKHCATHRPIPINRIDLLPTTPVNTSGINTGKVKNPRIISRPSTASIMINNSMNLTGRDVTNQYIDGLRTNFQNKMNFQNTMLPPNTQQVYTQQSRLNLANLMYLQGAIDAGVGSSILSTLSSGPSSLVSSLMSSSVSGLSSSVPSSVYDLSSSGPSRGDYSTDVDYDTEEETEQERDIRLEFNRRGQLGQIVGTEEFSQVFSGRPLPLNPQVPLPSQEIQTLDTPPRGFVTSMRERFGGGVRINPN